jgi:hypothetical protein
MELCYSSILVWDLLADGVLGKSKQFYKDGNIRVIYWLLCAIFYKASLYHLVHYCVFICVWINYISL